MMTQKIFPNKNENVNLIKSLRVFRMDHGGFMWYTNWIFDLIQSV